MQNWSFYSRRCIVKERARLKARRQAAVLKIVKRHRVASQQELARRLVESGCIATQASISRDLRELGLVKLDGRYMAPPRFGSPRARGSAAPFSELVTRVIPVGANLVVVRTAVGAASAVAAQLDGRDWPDVAGTLAGDDTILIAVRSRTAQGRVLASLRGRGPRERGTSAFGPRPGDRVTA